MIVKFSTGHNVSLNFELIMNDEIFNITKGMRLKGIEDIRIAVLMSASASKSARASSEKESTRYSYTASSAAAGSVREVLLRDRHRHGSNAASGWPC